MGLLDNVRKKATELAHEHPDQLEKISDQVIEKAGDAVDHGTHGKYASQVDSAQHSADKAVGEQD